MSTETAVLDSVQTPAVETVDSAQAVKPSRSRKPSSKIDAIADPQPESLNSRPIDPTVPPVKETESIAIASAVANDSPAPPALSKEEIASRYEGSVSRIAGLLVDEFRRLSSSQLAIGSEALELLSWEKANLPGWSKGAFANTINTIKTRVRVHVSIKAENIRVDRWVKAYSLQCTIREFIDGLADEFTVTDLITVGSESSTFDAFALTTKINDGWHDFFRTIATDRRTFKATDGKKGSRYAGDEFREAFKDYSDEIKAAESAKQDPVKAAEILVNEAVAKKRAEVTKANANVTTALSDAISKDLLDTAGAMKILETIASDHKKTLPPTFGLNPITANKAELEQFASVLYSNGRIKAIKYLHGLLTAMLEKHETADKLQADAVAKVNPIVSQADSVKEAA